MAYTKATPDLAHRTAYLESAVRLLKYTKPRSTYFIEFIEDPNEPWFVFVVKTLKKSNEMKSCSMIIQKDIPDWTLHYESTGWIKN